MIPAAVYLLCKVFLFFCQNAKSIIGCLEIYLHMEFAFIIVSNFSSTIGSYSFCSTWKIFRELKLQNHCIVSFDANQLISRNFSEYEVE